MHRVGPRWKDMIQESSTGQLKKFNLLNMYVICMYVCMYAQVEKSFKLRRS